MKNRIEDVWERIKSFSKEDFFQMRGKKFTFIIEGNYIILSTTNQKIPKKHIEEALEHTPLDNTLSVQHLRGPSYIYGILTDKRIKQNDW